MRDQSLAQGRTQPRGTVHKTTSEDDLFFAYRGEPITCQCACGGTLVAFPQPLYIASAVHGHQLSPVHQAWFARAGWGQ